MEGVYLDIDISRLQKLKASDIEESFQRVSASKFASLFRPKLHPRHPDLLQQGGIWAEERIAPVLPYTLMEALRNAHCVDLACYMYPNAEGRRALTLVKFCYWIIIFDDLADDPLADGSNLERLQRFCNYFLQALFGSGDDSSVVGVLTEEELLCVELGREWWGEMTEAGAETEASPVLQARIREALTAYALAQLRMLQLRSEWELWLQRAAPGPLPCSLEALVKEWRISSSAYLVLVLNEYDLGIELDEATLASAAMQQLIDAVSDHMNWVNNIFSFPKDMKKHETLNFLVPLHLHDVDDDHDSAPLPFGATLTKAWNAVARLEHQCAHLVLLISGHQQQPAATLAAQNYAHALCTVTASNFEWHRTTRRYPM